jgi:hypothetical protein
MLDPFSALGGGAFRKAAASGGEELLDQRVEVQVV